MKQKMLKLKNKLLNNISVYKKKTKIFFKPKKDKFKEQLDKKIKEIKYKWNKIDEIDKWFFGGVIFLFIFVLVKFGIVYTLLVLCGVCFFKFWLLFRQIDN